MSTVLDVILLTVLYTCIYNNFSGRLSCRTEKMFTTYYRYPIIIYNIIHNIDVIDVTGAGRTVLIAQSVQRGQ